MNIISSECCSIKEYNNDMHVFHYKPVLIPNHHISSHFGNNYYIYTIKAQIRYTIKCHETVKIDKINSGYAPYIYIEGSIPLWLNKYSIIISNIALSKDYTFVV